MRELTGHGLTARDQRLRQVIAADPTGAGRLRTGRPVGQAKDGTPDARAATTSPATGGVAAVRRRGPIRASGPATGEVAAVRRRGPIRASGPATGEVAAVRRRGPIRASGPATGEVAAVRRRGPIRASGPATGGAAPVRMRRHAAIASRATGTVAQDPVQVPGSVRAAGPERKGRRAGGHGPGRQAVPTGTVPTGAGPLQLAGLPALAGPLGRPAAAGMGRGLAGRGRLGPGRPGRLCRACQITSPPISWTLKPVLN